MNKGYLVKLLFISLLLCFGRNVCAMQSGYRQRQDVRLRPDVSQFRRRLNSSAIQRELQHQKTLNLALLREHSDIAKVLKDLVKKEDKKPFPATLITMTGETLAGVFEEIIVPVAATYLALVAAYFVFRYATRGLYKQTIGMMDCWDKNTGFVHCSKCMWDVWHKTSVEKRFQTPQNLKMPQKNNTNTGVQKGSLSKELLILAGNGVKHFGGFLWDIVKHPAGGN